MHLDLFSAENGPNRIKILKTDNNFVKVFPLMSFRQDLLWSLCIPRNDSRFSSRCDSLSDLKRDLELSSLPLRSFIPVILVVGKSVHPFQLPFSDCVPREEKEHTTILLIMPGYSARADEGPEKMRRRRARARAWGGTWGACRDARKGIGSLSLPLPPRGTSWNIEVAVPWMHSLAGTSPSPGTMARQGRRMSSRDAD